jgi:hypothetical protein
MNLSIFQETKDVGANQLVMALSKKTAQGVILHTFALPKPYSAQTQLHTFLGLENVVWYYQLFESPDGSATGTVRCFFDIQPNQNSYNVRDDLYLVADISPFFISGPTATRYGPDSSLPGWNWGLERIAQGTQQPLVKYVKTKAGVDTTQDDLDADGWRLAVTGDVIGPNEEWNMRFLPQLAATSSPSTANLISATNILTANTTLDNSAIGQAFWLMGGGGYFEVQLPDATTVPDNQPLYFMSNGGSHINVSLKCFAGQQIQWFKNQSDLNSNTLASRIVLGQVENMAIYKVTMADSSVRWVILYGAEGAKAVGEIVHSYSRIGLNYLFLDGNQGLSRTTYARAWDFISGLDASCVVSGGSWNATATVDGQTYNTNHGKFSTGDGSTTFGVPKIFDYGFLRAKSGTVGGAPFQGFPGDLQTLQLLNHTQNTLIGNLPGSPNGHGPTASIGNYNNQRNTLSDLTGPPFTVPGPGNLGVAITRVGTENRPDNIGIYMSMKI